MATLAALMLIEGVSSASAGVVVIANRTKLVVPFAATDSKGRQYRFRVESGEVIPLTVDGALAINFISQGRTKSMTLENNSIYYFHRNYKEVELAEIGLLLPIPPEEMGKVTDELPSDEEVAESEENATITVKLLVDDEQPDPREVWEKRLRERIDQASDVIEKHSGMRLKVIAVETWDSSDYVTDFDQAMADFQRKVRAAPAEVAIGFTSQYKIPKHGEKLGGTRGPFWSHILIREWPQHVTKPEAVELLVHEMGHLLGCVHSPELDSVMRPGLADRRIFDLGEVRFDPINTFILSLIAQERRRHGSFRALGELSRETRVPLFNAYGAIAQAFPDDPTPRMYVELLGDVMVKIPKGHPLERFGKPLSETGVRRPGANGIPGR